MCHVKGLKMHIETHTFKENILNFSSEVPMRRGKTEQMTQSTQNKDKHISIKINTSTNTHTHRDTELRVNACSQMYTCFDKCPVFLGLEVSTNTLHHTHTYKHTYIQKTTAHTHDDTHVLVQCKNNNSI